MNNASRESLTLVCLSDTHELHRKVEIPSGDILIFAGDLTFFSERQSVVGDFNDWLMELPIPLVVLVPGNHDSVLLEESAKRKISAGHLLVAQGFSVSGINIWGSPMTPYRGDPFGVPDVKERRQRWSQIPDGVHVLITHVPPFGILDRCSPAEPHRGNVALLEAVQAKKPLLPVFGHVHGAYGTLQTADTLFVNCALAGRMGDLDKRPMAFSLARLPVS